MRRPQFTLRTLLWLMAVVAAFCGGAAWQKRRMDLDIASRVEQAMQETIEKAGQGHNIIIQQTTERKTGSGARE